MIPVYAINSLPQQTTHASAPSFFTCRALRPFQPKAG
jgi:hypothetical protein